MRGDNKRKLFPEEPRIGSPPHAWGQYRGPVQLADTTVHPHMRGDNDPRGAARQLAYGSPPHAWGQFFRQFHPYRWHRFTPTCVGTINPWLVLPKVTTHAVHPHMRGDNIDEHRAHSTHAVSILIGSPPHAWGQCRACLVPRRWAPRFTPTCVGTMCRDTGAAPW